LAWDDASIAISSFNWLSTVVVGTRARGAEIGILTFGPNVRKMLAEKLVFASNGLIDISMNVSDFKKA
jgi:hypothetical protein